MNTIPTHPEANSYTTVSFADDYLLVKSEYSDWDTLPEEDKEKLLIRATRQIDMLNFVGLPVYYQARDYRIQQNLKFPIIPTPQKSFTPNSYTSTSVTNLSMIGKQDEPTGYWKGGALVVREGTGRGGVYEISNSNNDTGVISILGTFEAIDSTSQVTLIYKTPDDIKKAVCEQAFYLINYKANPLVQDGITSVKVDDIAETYAMPMGSSLNGISYSIEALGYIEPYVSRTYRMQT
jgi:hypothetical protein